MGLLEDMQNALDSVEQYRTLPPTPSPAILAGMVPIPIGAIHICKLPRCMCWDPGLRVRKVFGRDLSSLPSGGSDD